MSIKVDLIARRGTNPESYVAVDTFELIKSDTCEFLPKEALPYNHWYDCNFQDGKKQLKLVASMPNRKKMLFSGLCDWELSGAIDENQFYWNRTYVNELVSSGLYAPETDHTGSKEGECFSF